MLKTMLCLFILVLASPNAYSEVPDIVISDGGLRFSLLKYPLPQKTLQMLQEAVQFAIDQGSARKISRNDLFHGHPMKDMSGNGDTYNPQAILLHAQEAISYGPENYIKRNVIIYREGSPQILPCETASSDNQYEFDVFEIKISRVDVCTVIATDIGFFYTERDFYILDAESLNSEQLKAYGHNIRLINFGGVKKKVLFTIRDFIK